MASIKENNLELNYGWPYGESGWNSGMDENIVKLGFESRKRVSGILSSPPPSPSNGDAYIVGTAPTGLFSGKFANIAIYNRGSWVFIVPKSQEVVFNVSNGCDYIYSNGWVLKQEDELSPYVKVKDFTFSTGYTVTDQKQYLLNLVDNKYYQWFGALPKVVTAGATPATSGGIGTGAWVDRTNVTLRSEIKASSGTSFSIDISVKDAARQAVEGATGGKVTIMYDAKGNPNYMVRIPKFNIQDVDATLGTGVHPAFIVNGVEKSEIWIGQHVGSLVNGVLCSLPGKDPSASFNFNSALNYCRNKGSGWHTMTTMEWNAIALWCKKNGFIPRGNSNYGRSSDATYETGTRYDGIAPGTASGIARTITGSGPASWRHNNDFAGISDLVGNVWEWAPGFRLVAGELQVIANNDAAMSTIDLTATSASWKAIDGATGLLVAPGSANTVKIAASGTANYTLVLASGGQLQAMTNPGAVPVSAAALITLKLYGAYPVGTDLGGDGFWYNLADERVALRGGNWSVGALAGLFAVGVHLQRSSTDTGFGARPAFSN